MEHSIGSDLVVEGTEPEIGDLKVAVFVEEEVFRLEIAVEDAAGVAVADGGDELLEELAGLVLRAATVFGYFGEQLAALGELEDEEDLGFGGEDLDEADDVGVTEATEDGHFAGDVVCLVRLGDSRFGDDFDGDARRRVVVVGGGGGGGARKGASVVDFGEGATAEEAAKLVLVEDNLLRVWIRIRHLENFSS